MKDISANFLSHLQGNVVKTLTNALQISSSLTSDIYYFTDCYKDIIVDGNTYDSEGRFTLSTLRKGIGTQVDTLTISNIATPSGSNFSTIAKKKLLEGAAVNLFLVNREDTTEYHQDFKGYVSRVKIRDFTVDIELEGLASLLLQNVMKTYENSCILTFGSAECTFNTTTVTETGTLTSVTNRSKFIDTTRTEGDNHFRFGIFTFTSGNNNGVSRECKSYDGINKEFVVFQPFPYEVEVGDTYSVYQGCDKDPDTCKDEFSNFSNYQGYLHLVPPAEKLTYLPPDIDEDDEGE